MGQGLESGAGHTRESGMRSLERQPLESFRPSVLEFLLFKITRAAAWRMNFRGTARLARRLPSRQARTTAFVGRGAEAAAAS